VSDVWQGGDDENDVNQIFTVIALFVTLTNSYDKCEDDGDDKDDVIVTIYNDDAWFHFT